MVPRWRISKCCRLCSKWELKDRNAPVGGQIKRLDNHAEAVRRMLTIVGIEMFEARMKERRD
jgi:hypothetical protein